MTDPQVALIETIIAAGESYYAEFKSAWHYGPEGRRERDIRDVAKDVAEAVVAFSNSDGGDLLVGVEDDGAVTGVPWDGERLRYLVSAPTELVMAEGGVGVQVRTARLEGKTVLLFRVAEVAGEPVVTVDGRCLWRRGARTEPVPPKEIQRRREQVLGDVAYESTPVPEATLADLDADFLLDAFGTRFGHHPGQRHLIKVDDAGITHALRYWNLAEVRNGSTVLRRAALLLFASDPLRWHPNNRIRFRRIQGEKEGFGQELRTRDQEVVAPIVSQLPSALSLLLRTLEVERREESLFSTAQLLPTEAVEECLVNAVAHRNYAIEGQAIEVLFYPDRLEVVSPGRLPEPITVADLKRQRGVHRSRNPILMRVLRDLGWSRDQGEGMRRIFGSMRQVELNVPELEERAGSFIVRLSTSSVYDEATQAWIAAYGPFGLRPEDRKYVVALRDAGGSLSVDRLARQLGEPFDETKNHLVRLERQGIAWHGYRSRTYHVVEATNVPHERAYRAMADAETEPGGDTVLKRNDLRALAGLAEDDERGLAALVTRWQQAGILRPAGKGRWRLGTSFLEYLSSR